MRILHEMGSEVNARERVGAIIRAASADRVPVALWRHFPVADQAPETLAAATLAYQQIYDWDLVKVSPASSFCLRDWGVRDEWRGDAEGRRVYTHRVIAAPGDWERLPELTAEAPHLAAQLRCLRLVQQGLRCDAPLIQTVFSPLAQAKNLAGDATLRRHLREHPQAVLAGLATIARSTAAFVAAVAELGVDGIFYALQYAEEGLLGEEEYMRLAYPSDLLALAPARGLWCNVLHLHGQRVHFDLAARFGLPIVNWHDRDGAPSLDRARARFDGVLCGGLRNLALTAASPEGVLADSADALGQCAGRPLILGAGCVAPLAATHANLMALRRSVEPAR